MGALSFSDRARRSLWRVMPKRALSGAIGFGAGCGIPAALRRTLLTRFARVYGIDVSEAEKPIEDYRGFDDFFTRKLRPGARPIDSAPDRVVSPADGVVVESGLVTEGKMIQAKGHLFTLAELLADADAAARLEGGAYAITYLSPKDYHRVHAPVAGRVIGWDHVPGTLFSVNGATVRREPGLFVRNERLVTLLEMETGGLAAVVMVAAVGVGHITVAYDEDVGTHRRAFLKAGVRKRRYDVPKTVARGDELGTFHLGSTTVVVFEPGCVALDALRPGEATKMGMGIGRLLRAGLQTTDVARG